MGGKLTVVDDFRVAVQDLNFWREAAGRLHSCRSRPGLVLVNLNLGVSLGTKIHEHRLRATPKHTKLSMSHRFNSQTQQALDQP